jgi:hypothetical protein
MRTITFTLFLFIYVNVCNGQTEENNTYQLPYNSINIELLGNSYAFGSLNYERIVFHQNRTYLSGRFGVGSLYMTHGYALSSPILFNFIYNIHKVVSFEGGLGTTLFYQYEKGSNDNGLDPVLTGFIGLRLQHYNRGFCFRIGFVPFYDFLDTGPNIFTKHFVPWGGFSFGYSFGKN